MIKRIVKMTFRTDQVNTFLNDVFAHSKDAIRAFPGCRSMELLRDTNQPNVLFTFSVWELPDDLELYRQSPLFQSTWAKTKILFDDKPQAWSVTVEDAPIP
jgi:autoinducer 2-degrading protein